MHTDHRAQVEETLAEYRRSRDQLGSIQRELAAIAETAASDDRAVEVTVGSQGVLSDLRLTDEAYRRHSPSELAALIVRLSGEAAEAAAERARFALEPALPPGVDPTAVLEGRADLVPTRSAGAGGAPGEPDGLGAAGEWTAFDDGPEQGGDEHSWLQGSLTSHEAWAHRSRGPMGS